MAQFDFGPNVFAPALESFEDWLKYSQGRDSAAQAAGMTGMGTGIAQAGQLATTRATDMANRAREEALLAQTYQGWDDVGPQQGPPPTDIYSPEAINTRARLAARTVSTNQAMLEAQKNAAVDSSEAMAEQRRAQTETLNAARDAEVRLKNARAAVAEADAKRDPDAIARARLEMQDAQNDFMRYATMRQLGQGDMRLAMGAGEAQRRWLQYTNPQPTAEMRTVAAKSEVNVGDMEKQIQNFQSGNVGWFDDKWQKAITAINMADPEDVSWRNNTNRVFAVALQSMAGKQIPVQEKSLLGGWLPRNDMSDVEWPVAARSFVDHYNRITRTYLQPGAGLQFTPPGFGTPGFGAVTPPGFGAPGGSPVAPGMGGGGAAAPAKPKSRAEYDLLPSGTLYVGPDGQVVRKP